VARRYAREQGRPYPALRLIVAHLGSGITVSAHQDGRMIDSNSIEEGPFGVDRPEGCRCGRWLSSASAANTLRNNLTAMSSATAASSPTWARAT
jgi:butyrate kinase